MNKWIAEFELEDGDTMPEHMNLEYKGAKIDFHCRPKEPILDKIKAEIERKIEQEEFARSVFRHEEKDTAKAEQCTGSIMAYNNLIRIIDEQKKSEETK
jgi:hypothetical protein